MANIQTMKDALEEKKYAEWKAFIMLNPTHEALAGYYKKQWLMALAALKNAEADYLDECEQEGIETEAVWA